MRLLVVKAEETPAQIRARASQFPRVVLALLGQDATSRATLSVMRRAFTDPCWRVFVEGSNVLTFYRTCTEE
jgi:hypothetical protein